MNGKGIFSWNVPAVAKDVKQFVTILKDAGIERIDLKVVDGVTAFVPNRTAFPNWGENVKMELVAALYAAGIQVWGWGFHYGDNPIAEGQIAGTQALRFGLAGYCFDIESRFERFVDAPARAYQLTSSFHKTAPNVQTAFCSFALWKSPKSGSQWHNKKMYQVFLEHCNYGVPMMYWSGSTVADATTYLRNSYRQWRELTSKPLVCVGRAYNGDGGIVTPEAMQAFYDTAIELGSTGISWWVLDHAIKSSKVWLKIQNLPSLCPPPVVVTPNVEEVVQDLTKWATPLGYQGRMLT